MNKRIYVAGPWVDRENAKQLADRLQKFGYIITADWWNYESGIRTGEERDEFLTHCAVVDKRGVETADAVVLINSSVSEGKAVEQGIAIALDLPIIAIGTRGEHSKNVFHYLYNYKWVPDADAAIAKVQEVLGDI
jgi:nucleoside 2-deoxyribosyltransferase